MKNKYENIDNVEDVLINKNNNIYYYYILINMKQYDINLIEKLFKISNEIEKENPNKNFSFAHIPYFDEKNKQKVIDNWKSMMKNSLL